MSKTRIIVHIVFATKRREKTIPLQLKRELYAYIMGIVTNNKSTLIRINGMEDHVHILVDVHPTVSISSLVQSIKQSSSKWISDSKKFCWFKGWGEGFYAVSVGEDGVEACRSYIINQEDHHKQVRFTDELKRISSQYGLEWYEDDLS